MSSGLHAKEPGAAGACRDRDQALTFMRESSALRDGDIELVDVVGADEKVVVIMRPRSEGDEPAAAVANLVTFRDGKVVEMVHYPNADDALAAGRA